MAKLADYLISEVRYNEEGNTRYIDKVKVHPNNGDNVGVSTVWNRSEVVKSIENGETFYTIFKGNDGNWEKGAKVEKIKIDGEYFIRTDANNRKSDNLGNLPEF